LGVKQWAQRNLNVTRFRNGDKIINAASDEEWDEAGRNGKPAWCYYENENAKGTLYGKLYNWYAVNDSRGLCPSGWHVPSDLEWTTLTDYLGGESVAGGKMKATSSKTSSSNTGEANGYGFSALPGGYRFNVGSFFNVRSYAFFWSSTENYYNLAWYRFIDSKNNNMFRSYHYGKSLGASVRCLRD